MLLWWIGNVLALAVVVPAVALLAVRLLRVAHEVARYAVDVDEHGIGLLDALDPLPALAETTELTAAARHEAARYVTALRPLLPGR